jgi:hypothetical protein
LHAKYHGCEKVVALGLFLVNKLFGDGIDYPGFESIERDEVYREISEKA